MKTRRVRVDHQNPIKWSELTEDQKQRHNIIANYVVKYCSQNIGEYVTWESLDKQLSYPHIYSWIFDNYNNSHQNTEMIWDNTGIMIVDRDDNLAAIVDELRKAFRGKRNA